MKKQRAKNKDFSTILHIGKRNVELLDKTILPHEEMKCVHLTDPTELTTFFNETIPDIIIIEYSELYEDFISYLSFIQRNCNAPIIITSNCKNCSLMVKGLKNGADNFLCEPFSEEILLEAIFEALRLRVLWREVHDLQELKRSFLGNIIGAAPSMQALYQTIENVCKTEATVFIVAEKNVIKEIKWLRRFARV